MNVSRIICASVGWRSRRWANGRSSWAGHASASRRSRSHDARTGPVPIHPEDQIAARLDRAGTRASQSNQNSIADIGALVRRPVMSPIHTATATLPPRVLIYGPEGAGKTTLGSKFPSPVILQTEEGIPRGLTMSTFGLQDAFKGVLGSISFLGTEPHDRRTLIVDSLDPLEPLIWREACIANGWATIEQPGYGKG